MMIHLRFAIPFRRAAGIALLLTTAAALSAAAEPLAHIGATALERAEVEALVAGELAALEQQRHELLTRALDQAVAQRLLQREAEARGVTTDALEAELRAQVEPVTKEEVEAFYRANSARIPRPLEQVQTGLLQYLEGQALEAARQGLLARLRAEYEVRIHLEPYRVDTSGHPAPFRGPEDAPVEVTVFSDFQCPYCKQLAPELEALIEGFREDIRLVFRQFPLESIHPRSRPAARVSLCAARAGQFWEFHDRLFADPAKISEAGLAEIAGAVGIGADALDACLADPSLEARLDADVSVGRRLGLSSTPSVYVNGRPVRLRADRPASEQIGEIVREELAG